MVNILRQIETPLFEGIAPEERQAMAGCIGYHVESFRKGQIVAFENERIKHVGVVVEGAVDMIKEDLWGNKTMLVRIRQNEVFGETFACGSDNLSVVTFTVSEDAKILFLSFDRVMRSCSSACPFHHRLIENMVQVIASKNRDLMRKVEVVSKRTIREKLLSYLSIQAQIQDTRLFQKISFHLEENCHCALIGSNGTGKTTLMNLIREPEHFMFDGKLKLEGAGRIGYVSQFAIREGDQSVTVFDYLRQDFLALEQAINDVCLEMESAEDMDAVMDRYQALLDESDAIDADNHEVNIRRQLKLAELEQKEDLALENLSGGELKLVQIIRQMLRRPGLLIMDEPDVFLDFENLNGLRDLINAYKGTLLVVTHSRYLLAHCFDRIWHLENGDLQEYEGNFTQYSYARLQKKIDLKLASIADEEEIQRISQLVEELRDIASEISEAQHGRTLKSKVSYLNRLMSRQIKAPFVEIRQPEIRLPGIEPAETPQELLRLENYSLAFEDTLLEAVGFAVHSGEKVALVGANGTGKTSMLREIWKNQNPAIQFAPEAEPAFFSQLHAEILSEQNTIYQELFAAGFDTEAQVEEHLSHYCFDPDTLRRKVGNLSGGEKNLLQLAKLAAGNANLLLLDEPSSHLDTFAQIALEDAISAYRGAVLMVSHDFYTIVNCADTILFVADGGIRPMSARAFRKMIYKKHFSKDYLELELQRKDFETRIAKALEAGDCVEAQRLCDKLAAIVEQMEEA